MPNLNAGLYAERVGAINYVLADAGAAKRVLSQNKRIARALYSNPPVHGARIASIVVGRPELFAEWNEEMGMMAGRIRVRSRCSICLDPGPMHAHKEMARWPATFRLPRSGNFWPGIWHAW